MTTIKDTSIPKVTSNQINKILYAGLVLLGVYFLAVKDIGTALSNLGIALAFDPFNQKVAWHDRPQYQRVWLIVHLSVVFGLLGILLFQWLRSK